MQIIETTNECRTVHAQLIDAVLGEQDEALSSVLLDHVSKCRSCLKRWIALQAAADLAICSGSTEPDIENQRWRPTGVPASDGSW